MDQKVTRVAKKFWANIVCHFTHTKLARFLKIFKVGTQFGKFSSLPCH